MLHDLEVGQKEQVYEITNVDIQNMSEVRKTKMQHRFGDYLTIGLVLPYVNNDECLTKLLRLNRASHQVLRKNIFKCALLGCQPERIK